MKRFGFWQKWLLVSGVVFVLMGLAFAAISLFGVELDYINEAFWGAEAVPLGTEAFQTWIYGVYSALAVAFGLSIIFVASNSFKRKEKWSWSCLAICIPAWFVVDTFFSIQAGVYTNAFNNVVLFILLMLPLLFTRKDFVLRRDSV